MTVTLSADPERTLIIPIETMDRGGATTADYSGVPETVTFNAGDTSKSFTFAATLDTVDDDDEGVLLEFGTMPDERVSAGPHAEATVSITDDDDPEVTVSFEADAYSVAEGGSAGVKVTLSADPERNVTIPIVTMGQGGASSTDYSGVPSGVTFVSGETEKTITFMATLDTLDDDGESVKLAFGTMPDERVNPEPRTRRRSTSWRRRPAGDGVVRGERLLGKRGRNGRCDGDAEARTRSAPWSSPSRKRSRGATTADYSGVPDNVTFNSGEMSQSFTFTAVDDTLDDDDESVKLAFGTMPDARVNPGTPDEATVSITDDDDPEVTVSFEAGAYSADEGGTVDVTVTLSADPERTVTIDITKRSRGARCPPTTSGVPANVTFNDGGPTEMTFTFTATDDDIDDDGESVKLAFGTMPGRAGLSGDEPGGHGLHRRRRRRGRHGLQGGAGDRRGKLGHVHRRAGQPAHHRRDRHHQRPARQHGRDRGTSQPDIRHGRLEFCEDGDGERRCRRRRTTGRPP